MFDNRPFNKRMKIKQNWSTEKCICIYQPIRSGNLWHKVIFLVEFNRFEFRVFFLDWLPDQG